MRDIALAVVKVVPPVLAYVAARADQAAIGIAPVARLARAEPGKARGERPAQRDQSVGIAGVGRVEAEPGHWIADKAAATGGITPEAYVQRLSPLGRKERVVEVELDRRDRIGSRPDRRRRGCQLLRAQGPDIAQFDIGFEPVRHFQRADQVSAPSLQRHLQIIVRREIIGVERKDKRHDRPAGSEPRLRSPQP